jgi:hypothetical protein
MKERRMEGRKEGDGERKEKEKWRERLQKNR